MSDASRFCDVWALAQRRTAVQGEAALVDMPRLAAELVDTEGALRYRLEGLVDARGRAAARFELDGVVRVRCDRCGGPVEVPIAEQALFFFVADEGELAGLPIDEAPEEPLLGSHRFDLLELVEDQAILALPLSPHHDSCAAPVETTDTDEHMDTHRPFAGLAALKKPEH